MEKHSLSERVVGILRVFECSFVNHVACYEGVCTGF